MKTWTVSLAACLLSVGGLLFAGDVKSGLAEGETAPAFNVRDVTGPSKGKTLCYRCQYSSRPTVAIFTRTVNDNVKELAKKLDDKVAATSKSGKLAAFVVVLTDDEDATKPTLEAAAKDADLQNVPLTIVDGNGPSKYKLAKDAEVTVLMWDGLNVKVNHAYGKGEFSEKDVDACVADTAKILN